MEYADEEAETLNQLGYDHAGPLYHKVLPSAASYGAFYSKAESAMLLAGLALPKKGRDWSDVAALERLRICDPACGTGTLLMAALSRIKRLAAEACGNSLGSDASVALHKGLVENVLCGLDINKVAVQLAACNLTLGAPMTEFRRMHLYTMLHGVDDRSPARGGSIDLMIQAEDEFDLRSFIRPVAGIASSGGQRIETGSSPEFPVRNLDLIIMNPPFTANKRRNESMSLEHRKAMQVHELSVRDELMRLDPHAGTLVNANSIETFFTPLADRLLCRRTGTLAMVNPTTACTGPAARHKRVFLASRFHIEWLITSHDPSVIAFSHSTTIHETLIVAKRYRNGNRPPTKVVSLRKFPKDGAQAERLANALSDGDHKAASKAGAGAIWDWPSKFIEGGRWNAVVWSDPVLARTAESLAESAELIRLDFVARIQLPGQGCRKAYRKCTDEEAVAGSTRRAFWSVSAKLRKRIEGVPEQRITPRPNEERLAASYWQRKSHLLIAQKLNTRSGRILALWSPVASIGSMFMPLAVVETEKLHGDQAIGYEQALCAWFNSIPGLLQMLNMRASKITYPNWEPASWKSIRVPRPGNPHIGLLTEAYHRVKRLKVARLDNLMECRVRPILDAAAAKVLGVAEAEVARWRRLLAEEPTISGKPMKPHHAV